MLQAQSIKIADRCAFASISKRRGVHQHSPPPGRRPDALRACFRAVVPYTERRKDTHKRHEHAGGAQRREPS